MTKIIALDKARKERGAEHRARIRDAERAREQEGTYGRQGAGAAAGTFESGATASVLRVDPTQHARRGGRQLAVSVVVPTRGQPQLLNRCLASLALQHFDTARFEIIVVDDDPDDETRKVVVDWAAHCVGSGPEITYIPSMGPRGPAAARNLGWRAARGEIVAFTDDDAIPRADWLRNGLRAFQEDVHAVTGRLIMPLSGIPTDYERNAKDMEAAEFAAANCFCRRKVLEELGGFDERFCADWREDSDLHFRLIYYRAKLIHEPRAVVMHRIHPAPWGASLREVRKVQFDALLYKKHPTLYRRKIRAQPRWDFYLIVAALIATCVFAVAGQTVLAALFGTVWLLATGRFCLHRLRQTSKSPRHVLEMIVTSILIPPLTIFWRAVGAFRFRVALV